MHSMLATKLKVHDSCLNFATDAWTSPNGRAFVAVTAHYEMNGLPSTLLLDIMGCAHSHTRSNLASTFEKILKEFGISEKVR
jgi:hypothetical protein